MFSGVNVTINLGVNPQEVLNESLLILDDLQRHSWVDSLTMALLVTFLAAQPNSATPTAITIVFENPAQRGGEDSNPSPRWWSSHSVVAVDLRPSDVVSVLLTVFPFVHVLVMWFEANVPFALILTNRGEAARRCITLVTAVHVTVLALHIAAVCLHYSSCYEAREEVSKYYVSFDMRFNPKDYEDKNTNRIFSMSAEGGRRVGQDSEAEGGMDGKVPGLKWDPEYRISVRRITLARILYLKATSWTLLSVEVMLYLASFTLFRQHYSHTIQTAMRTIRGGMFRATVTVGPLLALLALTSYLLHRAHPVQGGEDFHTFAAAFRETVSAVLGVGRGVDVPKTTVEWVVGVTLLAVGVVVTLLFWRVCLSPEESRTMSTQRFPLHPL
uniref:Polycystin domain-containing protein n=1 Tax=Scylla olivacea TaxID=85551 RepID=A0A0P4W5Q4_SCYOL